MDDNENCDDYYNNDQFKSVLQSSSINSSKVQENKSSIIKSVYFSDIENEKRGDNFDERGENNLGENEPSPDAASVEINALISSLQVSNSSFINKSFGGYVGKLFQLKVLKSTVLELIPQIAIYIPINNCTTVDYDKFKSEIRELLKEYGKVFLAEYHPEYFFQKVIVIPKRMEDKIQKLLEDTDFDYDEVDNIKETLAKKKFSSLELQKPYNVVVLNSYSFSKQNLKKIIEAEIKNNVRVKRSVSFKEKAGDIMKNIEKAAELAEKNALNLSENSGYSSKNYCTGMEEKVVKELDKMQKESFFDYQILGIVKLSSNKEEEEENEGNNYPNMKKVLLLSGIEVEKLSNIYFSPGFINKNFEFGLGVYFTDKLDFAKFFKIENGELGGNFNEIPEVGEAYSFMVSSVSYNKVKELKNKYTGFPVKKLNHGETNEAYYSNFFVEENSLNFIHVDMEKGEIVEKNEELSSSSLRQYVVSYKKQILPKYTLTIKRAEYCVIWRDSSFSDRKFIRENIKKRNLIEFLVPYNLHFFADTEEALKLLKIKKYNKVILITNAGKNLDGKDFIIEARKILKFNVMALFDVSSTGHLEWITKFQNSLFSNKISFTLRYVLEYNEEGLNRLKEDIEKEYKKYKPKFLNFKEHLTYPLYEKYKKKGHYCDLKI